MAKRVWRMAVLVAAVLGVSGAAADASPGRRDLIVRIDNYVGVPPAVLARAKVAVEETFAAAGLRVGWDEGGQGNGAPDAMRLTLHVVKLETGTRRSRNAVLGLAARPNRRAFVFYDRLTDAAAGHPVDIAVLLARVMAHELGHLLLPPGPHARFGLMRGDIELAETGPDRFSEAEARQLQRAVVRRAVDGRTRSATR